MFGNSVYFDEIISDFQLCCGRLFSNCNLTLLVRILYWSANDNKPLFVVQPVTTGNGIGNIAMESEGVEMQSG